jgi:hypothetical protein
LWLQGFTIYEYEYGPDQIFDQVRALHEKGIDTYMFWNNKNVYDPQNCIILEDKYPKDTSDKYIVYDAEMNNPSDAAKRYLNAEMSKDLFLSFILKAVKIRPGEYLDYITDIQWLGVSGYEFTGYRSSFNTAQVFFKITKEEQQEKWVLFMILEDGFWKVNGYYSIK